MALIMSGPPRPPEGPTHEESLIHPKAVVDAFSKMVSTSPDDSRRQEKLSSDAAMFISRFANVEFSQILKSAKLRAERSGKVIDRSIMESCIRQFMNIQSDHSSDAPAQPAPEHLKREEMLQQFRQS